MSTVYKPRCRCGIQLRSDGTCLYGCEKFAKHADNARRAHARAVREERAAKGYIGIRVNSIGWAPKKREA